MTQAPERPTLARKHTKSTEANRKAAQAEQVYALRIDGEVYTLDLGELNGLHEMKLRRETGLSVEEVMSTIGTKPGLDVLGIFMWLCDLTAGGASSLEDHLTGISWASDVEAVDPEPAPEA